MHPWVDLAGGCARDLPGCEELRSRQKAGHTVGDAPQQASKKASARLAQKPGPYYRVREAPPEEAAQAILEVMRAERDASRAAQGAAQRSRRLQKLADVVALHAAEDLRAVVMELPERILPGGSHVPSEEAAALEWRSASVPGEGDESEAQGAPVQAGRSEAHGHGQAVLPVLEAARFPLRDLQQQEDVAFPQPRQLLLDPYDGTSECTVTEGGQDQELPERYPSWARQTDECTVIEGGQDQDLEESYPSWARQPGAARSTRHKRSAPGTGGFHHISRQGTPDGKAGPADVTLSHGVPRKRRSFRHPTPNTKPLAMECTDSPDLSAALATAASKPKQKDDRAAARPSGPPAHAQEISQQALSLQGMSSECGCGSFCEVSQAAHWRNTAASSHNFV